MNKVILMGRLTRDPETRYSGQPGKDLAIARFSLAVDRRVKSGNGPEADFFSCTAFGKLAEFVERYLQQGTKILLVGRIQNNNYTNREGQKVYGVQVIADEIEFAESRASQEARQANRQAPPAATPDGFMNIPDGVDDDELPFN